MGRNALTAKEWWDKGYRIIKGEKHRERNDQGVCVFYPDQVRIRTQYPAFSMGSSLDYSDDDDDDEDWGSWW